MAKIEISAIPETGKMREFALGIAPLSKPVRGFSRMGFE